MAIAVLLLFVVVYTSLYLILLVPAVQNRIRTVGERELSALIGTKVSIGSISINPLNELTIHDVTLPDKQGRQLAKIDKLGAGVRIYDLVTDGRIVFDYAELVGLDLRVVKDTPDSPMNLQFVIDAFKPKQKNKPPAKYDVALDVVVVRKSEVSFDVLSEAAKPVGVFDKNHIKVVRFNTDVNIPKIKNDTVDVEVKRLTLSERSGFELSDFTANIHVDPRGVSLSGLKISLPNSLIIPQDIAIRRSAGEEGFKSVPLALTVANSYLSLSDLRAFVPDLKNFRTPLFITCAINGTIDNLNLSTVDIYSENRDFVLQTSGRVTNATKKGELHIDVPTIKLHADTRQILDRLGEAVPVSQKAGDLIRSLGFLSVNGSLDYTAQKIFYAGDIATALGMIHTNGDLLNRGTAKRFSGRVNTRNLAIGRLLGKDDMLNDLSFDIDADLALRGGLPYGAVNGVVHRMDFKGYSYKNITADLQLNGKEYEGSVSLHDPNANVDISGLVRLDGVNSAFNVSATIADLNPKSLQLTQKYPNHSIGADIEMAFTGNNIDNAEGDIMISDVKFLDADGKGIKIDHFDVTARKKNDGKYITINSDMLNGYVDGYVNFARLPVSFKNVVSNVLPSLFPSANPTDYQPHFKDNRGAAANDFSYYLKIAENNELTSFFNLPVTIVHPIVISGEMDDGDDSFRIGVDAPFILQGNKVIEKTSLSLNVDGRSRMMSMNAVTRLDNKNGDITLIVNSNALNDRLNTDFSWQYDRQRNFSGKLSLSSLLKMDAETKRFSADIDVNPTTFSVNDTTWSIAAAKIGVEGKRISLEGVNVYRDNQYVRAEGAVSDSYDDELDLNLKSIDLGYVFETLAINHVTFGGLATGDFYASGLFTKAPRLQTTGLNVDGFSYNNALLGQATIKSAWDNDNKGIVINADIHQPNGRESFVQGAVFPLRDSLNFKFRADHLNVAILKPFMSAFSSDISGEASGETELYGTFKLINMRGGLFADSFKMKLDYTNTYYTVSDSILFEPGLISVRDAVVHDKYGNTARLNGTVRHDYFKNARFDFAVTDVRNMLCYDTDEKINPVWYGHVFASGSAFVKGAPGKVDIDINMSSSPNSSFAFALTDKENAGEYSFITFTDKQKEQREKEAAEKIPDFLKKATANVEQSNPSQFNLNLLVDVNPNMAITLVMDPEGGGDRIRGVGEGNMRIEYSSAGDLKMFGNYTVEQGRYTFTLQDIVIREFTIKPGGTIAFHGDPLDASVDLSAAYSLNANLEDLDESFATDRELNRTLVPVNALLNLSGVISQPEISFDLEFPTLSQDVYRKVKSIVSTDDMMNQQIIYLLALSRFYTPEYMGSTSRNNELASVASSTISNQLSNMLGQLSDKWSIAPNFHTDKGDFSDMEVELALSSRLLNNRLLLNGNFGYSDNAMNNNNFIGDFDIEYLLTKSGNFRLKAYNRYNDQNYYIRNSLTTQGVGIMFKHDFDRLFRRKGNKDTELIRDTLPHDSSSARKRLPVKRQ